MNTTVHVHLGVDARITAQSSDVLPYLRIQSDDFTHTAYLFLGSSLSGGDRVAALQHLDDLEAAIITARRLIAARIPEPVPGPDDPTDDPTDEPYTHRAITDGVADWCLTCSKPVRLAADGAPMHADDPLANWSTAEPLTFDRGSGPDGQWTAADDAAEPFTTAALDDRLAADDPTGEGSGPATGAWAGWSGVGAADRPASDRRAADVAAELVETVGEPSGASVAGDLATLARLAAPTMQAAVLDLWLGSDLPGIREAAADELARRAVRPLDDAPESEAELRAAYGDR